MAEQAAQYSDAKTLPISQIRTPSDLKKKMDSLRRGRQSLENQWKLNMAFYKGRQYSYFNRFAPNGGSVMSLPTEDGEKPRYRVRLVSNQIITGSHSLLAKYTKTKPQFTATPGSGSPADAKAAQMAERLMEWWWDQFSLDEKLEEALLWAIITGQGYWTIEWDPYANKPMTFLLRPDGTPIIDDSEKEAFRIALNKFGVEPKEKTVYLGDIKVRAKSPFQVFYDPAAASWEDAKYVFIEDHLDPDEIWSRWKVRVNADCAVASPEQALPWGTAADTTELTLKKVYSAYFLPTPALPRGRRVVWLDGKDDPLEDKPWNPKTNMLPCIKFPGLRTPGSVYDGSHVEQAIPIQKELNRLLSQIVEYKNLTIRPRVWAPTNSVRTRLTSEPGALYEYNPVGNFKPEIETMPSLPPYVFELLQEVSARLKDIFGLTDVSEGTVPPNVEAGIAIDLLQELSADRMAPTIKLIEKCLAKAGQQMLVLAQDNYSEPRMLGIKGSGGSVQVQKFSQADIAGGVTINVESGSGMPRTRAGRQAQIESWIDKGIIPADKAWKYLDIADLRGLASQFQADEDQAYREIEKIIAGQPINPEAVQKAMQAVNQGKNPQTGDPIQSPQEAQQILMDAAMSPVVGENYDVHLDVLGMWMKSVEFETQSPDVRQRAISHFSQTLSTKMSLPVMGEPGKLNTNLQIKATVGPTAAAQILNRSGINAITPEEMAEPPLDTWVNDSVDKPDADAAGPGQEGNQLSQAAATMLESTAGIVDTAHSGQIKQQKHEQDLSQSQDVHGLKAAQTAQQMQHSQEAHDARMTEHQLKIALDMKKLKESSFKPKPAAPAKAK